MMKPIVLLSAVLLCYTSVLMGQESKSSNKKTKVEILSADDFIMEDAQGESVKQLIGNVKLRHDSTVMSCDSAYLYSNSNTLKAYGHVVIEGEESSKLYGDSLNYNGNTRFAKVRGKVRLIDSNMRMTSTMLDFDRVNNKASYYTGGVIYLNDEKDTLRSKIGHYYTQSNVAQFRGDVKYNSEDFTLFADTLHYLHNEEKTVYLGPTDIFTSDSTIIYTERGWSYLKKNQSVFFQNPHITTESRYIEADSIFYDNKTGFGELWRDVFVSDTSENYYVKGAYAWLNEKTEDTRVYGDSALFVQIDSGDSLFLHGDSLLSRVDSATDERIIRAFPSAAFYRDDMQGRCDSLVFYNPDSTIKMFRHPIIWSDANEITADYIEMLRYDNEIHEMKLQTEPFIVSEEDSIRYNQIQGDSMMAYFKDNSLDRVKVFGNGNTLYYIKDGLELVGMNKALSDSLTIFIDSSKVKDILFLGDPNADLIPPKDLTESNQKLERFIWRANERPLEQKAIFFVPERYIPPEPKESEEKEKGASAEKKRKVIQVTRGKTPPPPPPEEEDSLE